MIEEKDMILKAADAGTPLPVARARPLAALLGLALLSGCFGGASTPDQLMTLSAVGRFLQAKRNIQNSEKPLSRW